VIIFKLLRYVDIRLWWCAHLFTALPPLILIRVVSSGIRRVLFFPSSQATLFSFTSLRCGVVTRTRFVQDHPSCDPRRIIISSSTVGFVPNLLIRFGSSVIWWLFLLLSSCLCVVVVNRWCCCCEGGFC
jgi:hypothetical protein